MDGSVLHVELTEGDVTALLNAADRIYAFIGYAQGEEARYRMRRDQIVVTLPISKKKPSGKNPTGRRCLVKRRQRGEVLPKRH